jgi:hypothetical protein
MLIKTIFYAFNVLNARILKQFLFIYVIISAPGALFNIFLILIARGV